MGVFAHPDDESLLAGGVLAQHHAPGARTCVVTTTWTASSHRTRRRSRRLGCRGAPAARLRRCPQPRLGPGRRRPSRRRTPRRSRRTLVAHIREVRPDLVIGHDALGQLTGFPVKLMSSDSESAVAVRAPAVGSVAGVLVSVPACVPLDAAGIDL
ncbi:PIG-L family deacetylase [Streptomyces halstedii]